jgi:hypothetical protein
MIRDDTFISYILDKMSFMPPIPTQIKANQKWRLAIPWSIKANNDISLQEKQRRNKYLSTSNPQSQIKKKTNGFNEDIPNKNLLFYIWYFQTNLLSNGYFKNKKIHIHFLTKEDSFSNVAKSQMLKQNILLQ